LQKNWIVTLVLRKVPIFRRKLTKIAENCEHNIGPGFRQFFFLTTKPTFPTIFFDDKSRTCLAQSSVFLPRSAFLITTIRWYTAWKS
jgi:hypothetical protein